MALSREDLRTIVSQWVGQNLSDEEVEALSAAYDRLTCSLAAFPDESLRWVEPAHHSVPAWDPREASR